jgi:hypothetical protein
MTLASSSRTCVAIVSFGILKIGNAEALMVKNAPPKATANLTVQQPQPTPRPHFPTHSGLALVTKEWTGFATISCVLLED